MPIAFEWDNDDHTIIRLDFHDKPTWDEYHTAVNQAVGAIKVSPHRVDLIFNVISTMPPGNAMPHMKSGFDRLTLLPHFGMGVVVTEKNVPRILKASLDIAMRTYGLDRNRQGGFFATLDDARAKFAQVRQTSSVKRVSAFSRQPEAEN